MSKILMGAMALVLVGLVGLVGLGGCSSDDGVGPAARPFELNLTVTDPSGAPVADLEAKLHVFLPQEIMPYANKPAVIIPFALPVPAEATLIVYDLDGNIVRTLLDDSFAAGRHQVAFYHGDEGRLLIGTHLYRCEIVASVADTVRYRAETYLTLYTSIDVDQRPVLGVTDDQGKITFNQRTEFAYLYNPGPQTAVDENGESRGTYEFPEQVEIRLADLAQELYLNFPVVVGQGRNQINLVWDETEADKPRDLAGRKGLVSGKAGEQLIPPPEAVYSLGPAYPNPFN